MNHGKLLTAAMDNVLAWKLGVIVKEAGALDRKDIGDPIDRGLVLRRLLEENNFHIIYTGDEG